MKQFLSFGLALVLGMGAAWAQSNPLLGKWKTKDDETGRIKSIVEITERDGKFYGQIIELFRLPDEDQDPYCDKCDDDRKDKRVLGMEIVRDMELDKEGSGKMAPFAIQKRAACTTARCGLRMVISTR